MRGVYALRQGNGGKASEFRLIRRLVDLSGSEFEALVVAMERVEGWRPGKEELVKRVVGARSDGRQVVAYLIERDDAYVARTVALRMADLQRIDAVVVHPTGRDAYLRSFPDGVAGNNLRTLAGAK